MNGSTAVEWDDTKNEALLAKHGIPFEELVALFADPDRSVITTARAEDGEDRQKVVGLIAGRLFTVVFVMRGDVSRIMSARRARTGNRAGFSRTLWRKPTWKSSLASGPPSHLLWGT